MRKTPARDRLRLGRLSALSAVACALALAPVRARAQDDDIYEDEVTRKTGPALIGVKIVEDSWKFVVAKRDVGEIPIPAYDVDDVVYAEATRAFASGIKRVKRRFYTKAIEKSFKPTMEKLGEFREVGGHPWPKQYCLYYLGYCHVRRGQPGDTAQALQYFKQLVDEIPNSRFIFEAYLGLAETHQSEQNFEEAEKAYKAAAKRFDDMARDPDVPDEHSKAVRRYALLAELRAIQMLDARGKYDLAISAYLRLAGKAEDYPAILSEAEVGAVRARVSAKMYDRAIMECKEMIDKRQRQGSTEYLGGAYLALADSYFERAGEEEATSEDLVVARWNYVRVATLYFFERKLLPKARFRAARCFERLAPQKGEGERAREQARRQYRLVVKEFPESPWAIEAQASLQALGGG